MIGNNGQSHVWIVAGLAGFGDTVLEVATGIVESAEGGRLPDEFPARRMTKVNVVRTSPETFTAQLLPWFCHVSKMVGPDIRVRGSAVLYWARATREVVAEVEEVWEPKQVKLVASPGEAEAVAGRLRQIRGGAGQ